MVQTLILVHLHPREDLLAKKSRLDLNIRRAADQPGQVDGHNISLVAYRVLSKVVGQELIVSQVEARLRNCLCIGVILLQMVVVIIKEVWLAVLLLELLKPDALLGFLR